MKKVKDNLLIFKMALIDLKKIYKGTVLGWFWLIAKPVMLIFIYWFAFSIGLKVNHEFEGYPYFLWLILGLLPWFYISEIFTIIPNIFKKYNYLVTKMKFPIYTIPIFSSLSRFIINVLLTLIVIVIYIFIGGEIDIYFIQIPIIMTLVYIYATSFGYILAVLGSVSKDFSNAMKTLVTPILFLSPILWNIKTIEIEWIKVIQRLNPINFIVESYRNIFIYKEWIFSDIINGSVFLLIIMLNIFITVILHKKIKHDIPDYL